MPFPDHKLITALERDIRNQVVIDQMLRLNRKGKLMVLVHRVLRLNWGLTVAFLFCAAFWASLALAIAARAEPASPSATPATVQCPIPGEKCKVLFLNENEENALIQKNGILDTAAQARNLDLGGAVVYFKTKIGTAMQGEVVPLKHDAPAEGGNITTQPLNGTNTIEKNVETKK